MTIPRSTAKKLCTDTEYRLINESFAPQAGQLTEKGLAQRIKRARTARDKYRSLAQRQTREARGRIEPRGSRAAAGNKNTVIKQQLFDETLARYEKLASRSSAATKTTKATSGKGTAATKRSTASGRAGAVKSAAKSTKATKATKSAKAATSATAKKAVKKTTASKTAASKSATKTTKAAGKAVKATKQAAKPASAAGGKSASQTVAKKATTKAASKPAAGKTAKTSESSAAKGAKKQSSRKSASGKGSRAGTITKPVKIPPLTQVIAAVSKVVEARKEEAKHAIPAPPTRSPKAPAQTNDGAPPGVATIPAPDVNPKGPEFPRNPHERGRLGSAFKQQQARRDSR